MLAKLNKYSKALVAAAGFFGVLASVLSDGNVSGDEATAVAVAAVTAVGVYFKSNG